MANARKDSPDRIKKMREMQAAGASAREIATSLGVTHKTVTRWLGSAAPKGATSRRKGAKGATPALAPKTVVAPPKETELLEELPPDAPLAVIRRRREQITRALDDNFDATMTGAFQVSLYKELAKLETFYLGEEARLIPPEPPDPEKDPNNIEATRKTASMLEALIEEAERSSRCMHCGKTPFADDRPKSAHAAQGDIA